jgi:hypothetical protein
VGIPRIGPPNKPAQFDMPHSKMRGVMTTEPVRIFLSYSWSSPTHESWVLALAGRLRQDGVDAILDKWDLQHGHDAYKFMEQMVTDASVSKVLMICDRKYAEKADRREGGAGAESQIISPELYGKSIQDKFAAAITEVDEKGNAYVPIFYKGRIYFDFSSDEKYEEQYEDLLRWIVGKPLRVKPPLGEPPRHLENAISIVSTGSKFQRVTNALRQGALTATGLLKEFSDALIEDFEKLRISGANNPTFDDEVIASIESARPYVDQTIGLITAIARYSRDDQHFGEFLKLLERLAAFINRPENISSWTEWDFDNYRYLCHEIFLTSFAVLLREERFDLAGAMVEHAYFIRGEARGSRATESYGVFRPYLKSLESRNARLNLNRTSLHADLLEKQYRDKTLNFNDIMQADFVLYLRDALSIVDSGEYLSWYPVTLVYSGRRNRPFDVFARSESKKFFAKFMSVLAANSVAEFKTKIVEIVKARERLPQYSHSRLDVGTLSNAENIGLVA